jgi:hypothetical protein
VHRTTKYNQDVPQSNQYHRLDQCRNYSLHHFFYQRFTSIFLCSPLCSSSWTCAQCTGYSCLYCITAATGTGGYGGHCQVTVARLPKTHCQNCAESFRCCAQSPSFECSGGFAVTTPNQCPSPTPTWPTAPPTPRPQPTPPPTPSPDFTTKCQAQPDCQSCVSYA